MPPRPFPTTLRIGTDICKIARVRSLLVGGDDANGRVGSAGQEKKRVGGYGEAFYKKVFTPRELGYFRRRFGVHGTGEGEGGKLGVGNAERVVSFVAGR